MYPHNQELIKLRIKTFPHQLAETVTNNPSPWYDITVQGHQPATSWQVDYTEPYSVKGLLFTTTIPSQEKVILG